MTGNGRWKSICYIVTACTLFPGVNIKRVGEKEEEKKEYWYEKKSDVLFRMEQKSESICQHMVVDKVLVKWLGSLQKRYYFCITGYSF